MNPVTAINKHFESRVRLGIMSLLMIREKPDFNMVRDTLEVTDGNLASHVAGLEKEGYIEVIKEFAGKKPRTSFRVTEAGRQAFLQHLNALEQLVKLNQPKK